MLDGLVPPGAAFAVPSSLPSVSTVVLSLWPESNEAVFHTVHTQFNFRLPECILVNIPKLITSIFY